MESSNIVPFPSEVTNFWIDAYYQACLTHLSVGTTEVYISILRHFTQWITGRARKHEPFHPSLLTTSLIERYFSDLSVSGYSFSHCKRAKSVITHFCQWLVDDKATLAQNPARGLTLPHSTTSKVFPPRVLSPAQRVILQSLIKKDDHRGNALFALGYWAGCRVTDITHLLIEQTHVGAKSGWLHLGASSEEERDIDLMNEARRHLYAYLQKRSRDETSPYVFTSQRSERLTEHGLHHWFRALKRQASFEERQLIADISFHDLRDDFAHRAREAGWTIEELAYYLGHLSMKGTLALQTTIRYTQMTRAQVKEKLKSIKG